MLFLWLTCLRGRISSAHDTCRCQKWHSSMTLATSPLANGKSDNPFTKYRGKENVLSLQELDRNPKSLMKGVKISPHPRNFFSTSPWPTADGQVLSEELYAWSSGLAGTRPKCSSSPGWHHKMLMLGASSIYKHTVWCSAIRIVGLHAGLIHWDHAAAEKLHHCPFLSLSKCFVHFLQSCCNSCCSSVLQTSVHWPPVTPVQSHQIVEVNFT